MAKQTTYVAVAVGIALLIALANQDGGKRAKYEDPEAALFSDPARAGPEIDRRLAESVKVRDGLVIIKDPLFGEFDLVVLPATPAWALHCGLGITVSFQRTSDDTPVSPDEGAEPLSTGASDAEITLTTALLDDSTCAVLAPMVASKIRTILRNR